MKVKILPHKSYKTKGISSNKNIKYLKKNGTQAINNPTSQPEKPWRSQSSHLLPNAIQILASILSEPIIFG